MTAGLVACSSNSESPANEKSEASEPTELSWKTGRFFYNDDFFGIFSLVRTDSTQTELIPRIGTEVVFDLRWINDSTYTLKYNRVITCPDSIELPDDFHLLERTCFMKDVKEKSYTEFGVSNLNSDTTRIVVKRQ